MQLEATDTADLAILREGLMDLAFGNGVPHGAQPFVARAARVLGTIVNGSAPDVPAAFAEVGEALEEAMRASEGRAETVPHWVPALQPHGPVGQRPQKFR